MASRRVLLALLVASVGCRAGRATGSDGVASDAGDRRDASPEVTAAGESFVVRSWSFGTTTTAFTLRDLGMRARLTDALGEGGRLAVNAGFFDPEGRAVGLAVSEGKPLSKFSATMSGGVFFLEEGLARIEATEDFDPKRAVDLAIQCRPRLVVRGHANVKTDDGQRAERTALCLRDEGRTVDVVLAESPARTSGPSLYALGQFLADQRRCEDALNLDGGPSTGVAYREEDGAARVLPPRGPLRYALVLR